MLLLQEIHKELSGVIRGMKFWARNGERFAGRSRQDAAGTSVVGRSRHDVGNLHRHGAPRKLVDLSRVDRILGSPISHQLKNLSPAQIEAIKSANAKFGNHYLDLAAERMATRAQEMLSS